MKYNINAIVVLTKGNIIRHDDDNRFYLYIMMKALRLLTSSIRRKAHA